MKKISLILVLCMFVCFAFALTSCSSKMIQVQVLDANGNVVVDQEVKLGAETTSANAFYFINNGKVTYAIDCLDQALTQAKVEYVINRDDIDSWIPTIIADMGAGEDSEGYGFNYYKWNHKDKVYENKTGLSAQHDKIEKGDKIQFRYEPLTAETAE